MATAADVLRIARGELGTTSGSKYWALVFPSIPYVNGSSTPYCACFASWVAKNAPVGVAGLPGGYCPSICNAGVRQGKVVAKSQAQPGDFLLFDWGGDGESDHIGILEANYGSYWQTIEGNTSGGIVARRTRYPSSVCHVIRPDYDGSPVLVQTPSTGGKLDVDSWGGPATVSEWQTQCGTQVDGVISGQYRSNAKYIERIVSVTWEGGGSLLVRAIQRKVGATVDGILGPETVRGIQRKLNEWGYGLTVDGYLGPLTMAAIQDSLNKGRWSN